MTRNVIFWKPARLYINISNCYRKMIVISDDDDDEDHAEMEGLEVSPDSPRQPSTHGTRSGSSSFDVIPASQPETPRSR